MTCARTLDPWSLRYGSFCAFSAWSSASRPLASVSPRVSRWYHWRILLRARDDVTSASQSREGPRPDFDLRRQKLVADQIPDPGLAFVEHALGRVRGELAGFNVNEQIFLFHADSKSGFRVSHRQKCSTLWT